MANPEVQACLVVSDGVLKVYVDKIDRDARVSETLNHEGEWEKVGLYENRSRLGLTVSANRTEEIIEAMARSPA